MERNAVLFLVLSVLIIIGYALLVPPAPPSESKPSSKGVPTPNGATPAETPKSSQSERVAEPFVPGPERTVTVETDLYRAEFSTRGGVIRSWRLKRYTNGPHNDIPIDLFTLGQGAAVIAPLAVMIDSTDEKLRTAALDAVYTLDGGDLQLSADHPSGVLRFEARLPGDQVVSKRLTFHHDSYRVDIELTIGGMSDPHRVMLGENFGIHQWGDANFVGYIGPTSRVNGVVIQDKPKKLEHSAEHAGTVSWTALQDKYFIAALMPDDQATTVVAEKLGEKRITVGLKSGPSSESTTRKYELYAGPKEYDLLVAMGNELDQTIDFGWFIYGSWAVVRLIAEPLFLILKTLHRITNNYGVAIILLTTLIKIVFIPLTHKSYMSMRAMQILQPQMQALQKKYKHDKVRLNQEMMTLYKTNKVNPLGGCLPMVLQIPFFVALFNILYTTIELRQAPFIFWIHDLSEKDPSYLLPILMGGTMFLQQKLQPTTMDPRQAKVMLFLPVIFTFFFLNFPSGLVLYWMVNNLLSILQQYVTMKYLHPPVVVVPKTVPKG